MRSLAFIRQHWRDHSRYYIIICSVVAALVFLAVCISLNLDSLLTVVIGVAATVMGTVGGLMPSNKPWMRWMFGGLGFVCVLAILMQGVRGTAAEKQHDHEQKELVDKIGKLQEQITVLYQSTTQSAGLSEVTNGIKDLRNEMRAGLNRIEKALKVPETTPPKPPTDQKSEIPTVEHVKVIERPAVSNSDKTPFAIMAIAQTDVTSQPTTLKIEYDAKVESARFFIVNQPAMMNVRTRQDGNTFTLSFGFPAFSPENPVVVIAQSTTPIHVRKIEKLDSF